MKFCEMGERGLLVLCCCLHLVLSPALSGLCFNSAVVYNLTKALKLVWMGAVFSRVLEQFMTAFSELNSETVDM